MLVVRGDLAILRSFKGEIKDVVEKVVYIRVISCKIVVSGLFFDIF